MIKLGSNSIGKIYLGSNSIGKAYLGSNLVYQSGSPTPATMIPYIRGGVGSYIDTGITADSTTRVIVWARNFNPNSVVLFGSRIAATNGAFGVFAPPLQNSGSLRFDYGSTQSVIPDAFTKMSGYHKYELNGANFYVDDVLLGTASATTFENSLNIYLFAINTNGTRNDSAFPIDICACQIYKNGTLVRDFTAVETPSVGLYDAVSDTVFTNSGNGSFTYGEFNENAYAPLEYIECSGAQYFDSGVYGTYSLPIISKVRSTNTTQYWMGYMGVFSSSPASCCAFTFGNQVSRNEQLSFRLGATTTDIRIFTGSSTNNLTDKDIVIVKNNNVGYTYYNNTQIGTGTRSGVATSFSTGLTMYVGATRSGESSTIDSLFRGRIYYVGLGSQRSFVPAKKGSRIGMYDTYNDVFYESASTTPFVSPTL